MRRRPHIIVNTRPAASGSQVRELDVDGRVISLVRLEDARGVLSWLQPRVMRREWTLASDAGTHALIACRGFIGRNATVETPDAAWSVGRSWVGGVELVDEGGSTLARVVPGWFGRARVEPASGDGLVWRWHWYARRTLEDVSGHEIACLTRRWTFLRYQAQVTLTDGGRARRDALALLVATFYAWLGEARRHAH